MPGDPRNLDALIWRVCMLVPRGQAATYGDLAELLGTTPRRAGQAMAHCLSPEPVAWWRVVNARGALPGHLTSEARAHWLEEGTPLTPDRERIRLAAARVDPVLLAERAQAAGLLPEDEPEE